MLLTGSAGTRFDPHQDDRITDHREVGGPLMRFAIRIRLFVCGIVTLLLPATALAQTDDGAARLTKLEDALKTAQSSADNSWMLVSCALVLMMTGPGLALFYGGLVHRKNVLSTMMQSFTMMAIVTVLWAIIGYSLSFGSGTSFIGG